MEVAQFLEKAD
jgi:hypothetical protein